MSDDAVRAAVENLRKVLMENGMDEGTANAVTSAAMPNIPSVVGNLADLQRLGAAMYEGTPATQALEESVVPPPPPGEIPDAPAGTTSGAATPEQAAAGDAAAGDPAAGTTITAPAADLSAMTKQQLQDYADDEGIDGVDQNTQTRQQMIDAINAG